MLARGELVGGSCGQRVYPKMDVVAVTAHLCAKHVFAANGVWGFRGPPFGGQTPQNRSISLLYSRKIDLYLKSQVWAL